MQSNRYWLWMRLTISVMFRVVLPLAAHLPLRMGMWIASGLGMLCYRLDLDWRTVAMRKHYVANQTRSAFAEILPNSTQHEIERLVRERFLTASKDELEAYWLYADRARECVCKFEGLDAVQEHLCKNKGLVLLTIHFDSALMGVAQLGLVGCKLNLMTSEVIEDQRLPQSVQLYFRSKRYGVESHLNGGKVLNVETKLKSFYDALKSGEGVVIFGEAPTAQLDSAKKIRFLGKYRAVAPGAFRIAEKMECAMVGFVCLCVAPGQYKVIFSQILSPNLMLGHSNNADVMFDFFSEQIRNHPGRWWAADQLPNFVNLTEKQQQW